MRNLISSLVVILICFGLAMPALAKSEQSTKKPNLGKQAKDATSKPSVGTPEAVDFGPFMKELQVRIKRAWYPPKSKESKKAQVVFRIFRNGRISNIRLSRSSGNQLADQAAIKAIQVQSFTPALRLPPKSPEYVDIQFSFAYNVFGRDSAKSTANDATSRNATRNSHGCCGLWGLAVPAFLILFVGLINVLRALQRRRAPIWIIGATLLGFFTAIGFLWPLLNAGH